MSSSPDQTSKIWFPEKFTIGGHVIRASSDPFIVIITNQSLENRKLLLQLCSKALLVVCADGGANQLKDLDLSNDEERICGPNIICGDLDSIRPEVMQYYESKGVQIIKDTDQYSTDLTKCLKHSRESHDLEVAWKSRFGPGKTDLQNHPMDVAIFGGLGGRADQAFSQLHHLYMFANQGSSVWKGDLYLIASKCLMFLLDKGPNTILAPRKPQSFTENVGIIPIGRPCLISTRGFEWDVKDWPTEFGTQMSTSNHLKQDSVHVHCTERVLLTLEMD